MTRRKWINIILHSLFWIATAYWFTRNSFIRSCAPPNKEITCVLFIMATIYLNYFVLIPNFYLKRKHILYFSISLLSVVLCTTAEIFIVKECLEKCLGIAFEGNMRQIFWINTYLVVFLRNLGFLCFFILLRFYQISLARTEQQNQSLAEERQILSVLSQDNMVMNLNINKIYHFMAQKNILTVTMADKRQHQLYMSLADIENILSKSLYIKANRNYIVMLNSIARYDDQALYVKPDNLPIPFYTTKKQEIKDKLYEWNPELYQPEVKKENLATSANAVSEEGSEKLQDSLTMSEKNPEKCDKFSESVGINEELSGNKSNLKTIYNYVCAHPGCRVPVIIKEMDVCDRTVERNIKILRDKGLIVYRGNPKTGGYYAVENPTTPSSPL